MVLSNQTFRMFWITYYKDKSCHNWRDIITKFNIVNRNWRDEWKRHSQRREELDTEGVELLVSAAAEEENIDPFDAAAIDNTVPHNFKWKKWSFNIQLRKRICRNILNTNKLVKDNQEKI